MRRLEIEIRETLERRHGRARRAMRAHLARLADAPDDPLSVVHPLGGVVLDPERVAACRRSLPALWAALRQVGIGDSAHSFGGSYFLAEPSFYLSPPSWVHRRRAVDARIRAVLDALPARIRRSELDFPTWMSSIVALDLLRTDFCSVLWNELMLEDRRAAAGDAVARCEGALRSCVRATLELLPPAGPGRPSGPGVDREADVVLLGERIRPPSPLGPPPPGLADDSIRAHRASDNTFLVWASLSTLAAERRHLPEPCWAIGNGFGGIDLGHFVAETLTSLGLECEAGTCRVGGHRAPRAEVKRARWPADGAPASLLFCDDSISSGGTFAAFEALCAEAWPSAAVDSFVLTYDLGAARSNGSARAGFARARHATAPAPWSPSPHPKVARPETVDDLLAALRGSSDERLRWIAETQSASIRALNEAPR